jgi:hypothetical protein
MGEDYGAINGLYIGGMDLGLEISAKDGTLVDWWDKSSNMCTTIGDNSFIQANDNSWIPNNDNGTYSTATGFVYDAGKDYAAEWLEKMRMELDKQCTNVEKEKRYEIRHGAHHRRKYRSLEFKCTLASNWKNILLGVNGRYVLKHR